MFTPTPERRIQKVRVRAQKVSSVLNMRGTVEENIGPLRINIKDRKRWPSTTPGIWLSNRAAGVLQLIDEGIVVYAYYNLSRGPSNHSPSALQ